MAAGAPGGAPARDTSLRPPPPGRYGGLGAGGPPLGQCAATSGGASGRPCHGYRSAGRGGQRRACWNRQAPGPPRGGWGSRGKRRPWDGWRGTPASNAPPQRPGKGAAGACVSPCARRGGWGSAGVVLAPAMAPPRSADSVCACVVVPAGSCTTQRPISSALESGPAGVLTRCAVWASPGARYSSIRLGRLAVSISRFCRSSRLQRSRWARAAAVIRGSATRTPLSVSSDDTKLATEPHIEPLGGKPMQLSKTIKVQFKLVESWEKITSQAIRGWHNKSIDQNDILMMNGKWRCLGAQ